MRIFALGFAAFAVFIAILIHAPLAESDEKKPVTFNVTMMGEIVDRAAIDAGFRTRLFPDEVHLGFKKLDASDGQKLVIQDGEFRTPDEAARYLDWSVQNRADRVITNGKKVNREGKTVGRRTEVLLKSDSKTKTWMVAWTDEAYFFVIYAPTLECALQVEKQSQH
jgi:hypothetical protein